MAQWYDVLVRLWVWPLAHKTQKQKANHYTSSETELDALSDKVLKALSMFSDRNKQIKEIEKVMYGMKQETNTENPGKIL